MFFIASKVLHFLIKPILWVFFGVLYGVWKKRGKKRYWLGLLVFAYLVSNQFLVDLLFRAYEPPPAVVSELPDDLNGVILLGGYSSYMPSAQRSVFKGSGDRFLQMLHVHRAHKVSPIILTGGSGNIYKPGDTEARFMQDFLEKLELDTGQFVYDPNSRNTYQNAVNTQAIIQERGWSTERWLLITSAFHMPRSVACFKKAGMEVFPFPVDHRAGPPKLQFEYLLLPSVEALGKWEMLLHEWIGYASYKVTGKV